MAQSALSGSQLSPAPVPMLQLPVATVLKLLHYYHRQPPTRDEIHACSSFPRRWQLSASLSASTASTLLLYMPHPCDNSVSVPAIATTIASKSLCLCSPNGRQLKAKAAVVHDGALGRRHADIGPQTKASGESMVLLTKDTC